MIIADAMTTADITVNAVILDNTDIANNSCAGHSNQHK